jgi:mono/diheme cytochrome c family protein
VTWKGLIAGIATALAAEALLGFSVLYLGLAPVAADQSPSALEARVMGVALHRAIGQRTSGAAEPAPASAEDVAAGSEIYKEMCARCHGEPGAASSPLGSSFYPPAPLLPGHASEWSERELFWIIKHGIRNTAMPAWAALLADDDIRQVAALVKRFDAVPVARHTEESAH